jgi:hypothetical protein
MSQLRLQSHTGGTKLPSSACCIAIFIGPSGNMGQRLVIASSRASALRSTADRLVRPRASEDGVLEGRPTALERLGYTPRNRNRSLSVGGGKKERVTSPTPRSTKWLCPRTAKAFAAASLRYRKQALSRAPGAASLVQ